MKARFRDHLPRRFKTAVTLARRALQCERLESRCLLHAMPLAIDCESGEDQNEAQTVQTVLVATSVLEPLPPDAIADAVTDVDGAHSQPDDQRPEGDDQQPPNDSLLDDDAAEPPIDEPIDLGGLPEPEGEARSEPLPMTLVGSDVVRPAWPNTTGLTGAAWAELGTSASGSRVVAATDTHAAAVSSIDSLTPSTSSSVTVPATLSFSAEEAVRPAAIAAQVESTHSNSLSYESGVQSQNLLTLGLQAQSLQQPGLHTDSDVSTPWFFSSPKSISAATSAQPGFSTDHRFGDAVRSTDIDDTLSLTGSHLLASGSRERAMSVANAAASDEDEGALNELRATIERISRERKADRASASPSMHEQVARHAKGHIQRAHLRVREDGSGLVELAIEPSPMIDVQPVSYAAEQASASPDRGWVFASMGLYREFDLAAAEQQPAANFGSSDKAVGSSDISSDALDALQAVDAAHAEDEPSDAVTDNSGQNALPLGLVALSGLLAISRHRYARKHRQANDA